MVGARGQERSERGQRKTRRRKICRGEEGRWGEERRVSTVEPLNKGHFGANSFVPCREVVPISEVKKYTEILAMVPQQVSFVEKLFLSQRVPYQKFHCIYIPVTAVFLASSSLGILSSVVEICCLSWVTAPWRASISLATFFTSPSFSRTSPRHLFMQNSKQYTM